MTTNRFQPGDKVRAGIFTADIGLTPNRVYTVHHVDDFGQVQPDSARHHHYHPSHFELVMRKVWDAAATYSLKDGEGDWWFLDMAPDAVPVWRMVDRTDVVYDAEDGIEEIARDYGIDGTPTAPETYYLKDKADGDWHVSTESAEGPFLLVGGDGETYRPYEEIADRWGIDAEPIPAVAGVTVHEPGNSTGPSLHFEAAPLQPGDWVKVLARVEQVFDNGSIRTQTFQSDGAPNGPRGFAIASAITRTDEVPEWAKEPERLEEPTTLGAVVYSASAAKLYTRASICMGETHVWANNVDRCWYSWEQLPADAKVVDPERLARAEVTER